MNKNVDSESLNIRKFAAIDIGSNAIRLLITNIIEKPHSSEVQFNKNALVRLPVRLGQDVFTKGEISLKNINRIIDTMKAFSLLMKVHQIEEYRAFATSAMREALNSHRIIKQVKNQSGINIELIDGKKEASIISNSGLFKIINKNKTFLYVDVGGGSTEYSIFYQGQVVKSKSFKIGTVRLLNNQVDSQVFDQIKLWIVKQRQKYGSFTLIGSGGNINKIFKISGKAQDKPLSYSYLKHYDELLNSMSYQDRITKLKLNPDRADVIVHALKIYLKSMKWSRSSQIIVPKIGLSDGMIKSMYFNEI